MKIFENENLSDMSQWVIMLKAEVQMAEEKKAEKSLAE
jgi:hypothetical protein